MQISISGVVWYMASIVKEVFVNGRTRIRVFLLDYVYFSISISYVEKKDIGKTL